ncbi:MAG: ATP-binding protein [Nitrospira sp.]
MARTSWFDGDMCAAFGALLYRLGSSLNNLVLLNIQGSVERILSKNGFLSNYGRVKIPDTWGTTIPYQRFDVKDDRFFASYIEQEFVQRPEMPKMSKGLIKKFRESVFEIFSNSVLHSQTELGIFSCGQYFPRRNRLDFAVADLGIGIKKNVSKSLGLRMTAPAAIEWATSARNTTKTGSIPGGLGLKLLKEFITLNKGRLQIVSDSGYWCLDRGASKVAALPFEFPGTVVAIEINTADRQSYALSSEVDDADIF